MGKLFGTDGVRGLANEELTPEIAFNLGKAGAYVLTKMNRHAPRILVGMDTRVSGDMLEAALSAGMCAVGARVHIAGVLPTPAIAYLVRKYQMDAGVVISASHNPFYDNGIKFFSSSGYKLPDAVEDEIERLMLSGLDTLPHPSGKQIGYRQQCVTALFDYVDFLLETVDGMDLSPLKIAMDCANGATYMAAPRVFQRLGADLHVIHASPDGLNINKDCGSTHIESLMAYVVNNGMDLGIAFDGDGDRCLIVDETGHLMDGDQIMSVCAVHLKKLGQLKKDTLVATVMSNLGLTLMGEATGIRIEKTGVGDRYVLERMLEGGYNLGGEQSGHVIFLDENTTGDGLLTALHVVSIMTHEGKQKLSDLNCHMTVLPQVLVNARVDNQKKPYYLDNETLRQEIEAIELTMAGRGRVLIRPSGTEPVIRVMLEGDDRDYLDKEARRLAALFEKLLK